MPGGGRDTASVRSAEDAGTDGIVWAGVPPEGIPAIDEPRFVLARRVDDLAGSEPVVSVGVGGEVRAYPVRILMFHEIVNDVIAGVPVTVTYCPLCNSAVAFRRPVVDGRLLDFGVSGSLLHSNLLMYDRQTGTYWAQVTGEAIEGALRGRTLEQVPAQMVAWRDWRCEHPDGRVLDAPVTLLLGRKTGAQAPYGLTPYGKYDSGPPPLFEGEPDPRLPPTARVLGLRVGAESAAVPYRELRHRADGGWAAMNVRVGGEPFVVFWKSGTSSALDEPRIADGRNVGSVGAFDPRVDGRRLRFDVDGGGVVDRQTGSRWSVSGRAVSGPLAGTRLHPIVAVDGFWFDWAAFHPDTAVLGSAGSA
jgi:hypothetical protein